MSPWCQGAVRRFHPDDLIISIRTDPDPKRRVIRLDAALTMIERPPPPDARPSKPTIKLSDCAIWEELITL